VLGTAKNPRVEREEGGRKERDDERNVSQGDPGRGRSKRWVSLPEGMAAGSSEELQSKDDAS